MDATHEGFRQGQGARTAPRARVLRLAAVGLVVALHWGSAQAWGLCAAAGVVGLQGGSLLSSLVGGLLGAASVVRKVLPGAGGASQARDCMPAEPASVPASGASQVVGNPVDLVSGAKLDRAVDVHYPVSRGQPGVPSGSLAASLSGAPVELLFSRLYSSADAGSPALGPGWRHGFETRLHEGLDAQGRAQLQVLQGDGRLVRFGPGRPAPAGVLRHEALRREDGVLDRHRHRLRPGPGGRVAWTWRWRDGRTLGFAADGRLVFVAAADGLRLSLSYEPESGRLAAVRDAEGRALQLEYGGPAQRLVALRLADGSQLRYGYDERGRLASVRHPGGEEVRYRYAPEGLARLAGVTLPDGRSSGYRYDASGRVVHSRGVGDPEGMALQFSYPDGQAGVGAGAVEVSSSLAGETRVLRNGRQVASYWWRTLEDGETRVVVRAEGEGCDACPPTGVAYGYRQGRLTAMEAGDRRWRLVHDPRGRLVAVRVEGVASAGVPAGPGPAWAPDGSASTGKASELPSELLAVRWAEDAVVDRPLRASRPSVAPGRRHLLHFDYSADGRLRAVREAGFAPTLAPAPGGSLRAAGATPIHRGHRSGEGGGAIAPEAGGPMQIPAGARNEGGGRWVTRTPDGATTRHWVDDFGRAVAMRSADSGLTRWVRDSAGRLVEEHTADGSVARIRRDARGRLVEHALRRGAEPPVITRFRYRNGRVAAIRHPHQDEFLEHDAQGRLAQRTVRLRLATGQVAEFRMRYRYEGDLRRPAAWSLPDGSWVLAAHDPQGRVRALERVTADGAHRVALLDAVTWGQRGLLGAVYGNGARLRIEPGATGRPARICHASGREAAAPCDLLDHRLHFDGAGNLLEWVREDTRAFHLHDAEGRLLQVLERGPDVQRAWRYAYDRNGNRLPVGMAPGAPREPSGPAANRILVRDTLRRADGDDDAGSGAGAARAAEAGLVRMPQWDRAGRIVDDGQRRHRWTPMGLLAEVAGPEGVLAEYRYDHRGLRIAARSGGRWRHFLFDEHRRPLAELDEDGRLLRQYLHVEDRALAVIDHQGGAERTAFLHHDHRGAPVLATDGAAVPVWRARYAPFGRVLAIEAQAGFALALRLPGQHEDAATGLHYNDHRWYDPDTGRYLSPDPLGLRGGPNPYVYAGNDPMTRVDPSGLLLFAFDGTNNGDPPPGQDDWSNVYKLSRAYADGRVWYMAGVGRPDAGSGIPGGSMDLLDAGSARARVDYMLDQLTRVASLPESASRWLEVDVIGFSRGAAMARDFANRVSERIASGTWSRLGACVRLRFLGLWDTVAQFGAGGTQELAWKLSVPADVAHAAHAVALNEHRTLFPVESIEGAPAAGTRIERGFIGAHSDIGGSYAEGDLSDVALVWMHAQARSAGVAMLSLTSEFTRVTAPLLHDSNTDGRGDREFRLRNAVGLITSSQSQRSAPVAGMQWDDTAAFVQGFGQPQLDAYGAPTLVGTVGMEQYADWLWANYGLRMGRVR